MMREDPLSLGSSFQIGNEQGDWVFRVEIDASRPGVSLVFGDLYGHQLCAIDLEAERPGGELAIERGGVPYATVRWPAGSGRDRVLLVMPGGDLEMRGNLRVHEYVFQRFGHRVAKVSKSWLRLADAYTVEITPGQEDAIILAATIAVDRLVHESA